MSASVWPPVAPDDLLKEEEASLARELEWLLDSLQDTLHSLKAGLEECVALLAPRDPGSTLVLSSVRSESIKGFVTRVGTRIVKGNIRLRLPSLPHPRGSPGFDFGVASSAEAHELIIDQLISVRTSINSCLDVVDASTWTGDKTNANFISGQLRLLYDNLEDARQALKGDRDSHKPWWENALDEKTFDPPLPPNLSLHFYILDAALVLEVRTLEPYNPAEESAFSLRRGLGAVVALGSTKTQQHDEVNQTFSYMGKAERVSFDMAPALLTAVDSSSHVHLIIGSNPLAGARCSRSLGVGARAILLAPEDALLHYGLTKRIDTGEVEWLKREFRDEDLTTLGREEINHVVDAVFVTLGGRHAMSTQISSLCRRLRIPINVADAPNLCSFTLLSQYSDGPLQVGVTTSGKGCKLASRIRREIASSLPSELGQAVDRLGSMRRRIWEEDHAAELALDLEAEEEDSGQPATFNKLVTPTDAEAAKTRRMRWLAQICEYWPLRRLASITDADIEIVLKSYTNSDSSNLDPTTLDNRRRRGKIILAGTGPGHPDLLTTATLKAIQTADIVLADKLVPGPIMDLVPRRTTIHTAKKFPGNADAAQEELHRLALQALQAEKTVLRLKQGDPYIFGRGAEEFHFFREKGYIPVVLPGVTSALSAPLFANIPPTHRAVADQVLICTGTGRHGQPPDPPEHIPSRTVVFLMALHRLGALVTSLTGEDKRWPKTTPCAVVERASCPDQRVLRSTLEFVTAAVEEEGSRPPGLIVVGAACGVLEELKAGERWRVEDGFEGLEGLSRAFGRREDFFRDLEVEGVIDVFPYLLHAALVIVLEALEMEDQDGRDGLDEDLFGGCDVAAAGGAEVAVEGLAVCKPFERVGDVVHVRGTDV
ncbi:hypothetical protein M501DRAFT_1011033 [Patellaria atrata CBS 101060]|uniref:Precorrin-2 dehydrogenase n=1 Tax=Patellaria atrata CBS 101060 TaxID=1346257 RepID=A0A9P4VT07_9PEZI|nr:hypothetical protein M501DRAFT_1011033 [Patellaria atrata CBS 101060]